MEDRFSETQALLGWATRVLESPNSKPRIEPSVRGAGDEGLKPTAQRSESNDDFVRILGDC